MSEKEEIIKKWDKLVGENINDNISTLWDKPTIKQCIISAISILMQKTDWTAVERKEFLRISNHMPMSTFQHILPTLINLNIVEYKGGWGNRYKRTTSTIAVIRYNAWSEPLQWWLNDNVLSEDEQAILYGYYKKENNNETD